MPAIAEILAPGTATPVDDARAIDDDDDQLSVADLVSMFEESEDATNEPRKLSERDRDYVDNKQLTDEELSALSKRGQPPMIDNRIKSKVDYLVGLEKQQRVDPRAFPRTPQHEQDADGATQALRYVAEEQNYDNKRSGVWRNLMVEGAGGYSVSVEMDKNYGGRPQICIRRTPWDRMFWDPHSSESDFSDAGYLGIVLWLDIADAKDRWPDKDAQEALDTTMQSAPSDTYDDKPKFNHWADKKRKRVRVCQIWIRKDEDWHFAEFTKGGILKAGPSPYVNDQGESDCELFFQSAYVDRDNNRYGLVREMISLQDAINKRHSKALHQLNTLQVWMDDDALPQTGVEKLRKEAHRPDGVIVLNPGSLANKKIQIEKNTELASGQVELLQHSLNAIDLKGPNATSMGDKAQGSAAASGRAILASQQGGMVSLGDLLDNLRHLDVRVFRAIWARIRQYWTEETWIRVTDDERNIKWVGMNVDPQQVQLAAQQNPEMAGRISGAVASVAELDCDIIIDDAPDTMTPQIEQFQALVELKKMDQNGEIPFRAIVEAIPNLKDRGKFLDHMDEQAKQPKQPPLEVMKAQLDAQIKQQAAQSDAQIAQQKAQQDAQLANQKMQIDTEIATRKQQSDGQAQQQAMELKRQEAAAEIQLAREKAEAEIILEREKAQRECEVQDFKMNSEHQQQERKFKFESGLKRKQMDEESDDGGGKTEGPVMKVLEHIVDIVERTHKAASAPRKTKLVRGKDGKATGAVSTVEA